MSSVGTNRYSVPERYVGKPVCVYKTPSGIEVRRQDKTIALHRRVIDQRDTRSGRRFAAGGARWLHQRRKVLPDARAHR
jgi:hypothetical protein